MAVERVYKKIIQSGNIIEFYQYEIGYLKGYEMQRSKIGSKAFEGESEEEVRKRSLRRAKTNLRRLINANHGQYGLEVTSKFMTLTFAKNITDLKEANIYFTKFVKRLNYKIFNTKKACLKYTVVVEPQKRGAIHYHMIVYNMPFVKQSILLETWRNGGTGGVHIKKIDDIDNVGAYLGEYLGGKKKSKSKEDFQEEFKGQKSYFSSRGLHKPVETTDRKKVETVAAALPFDKLKYSSTFENDYLGRIIKKEYNLNK